MTHETSTALVKQGLAALDADDLHVAQPLFTDVVRQAPSPVAISCLGYCLARRDRDLGQGFAFCRQALRQEPGNPLHYLNLGRVYLLSGDKRMAVRVFRRGLRFGRHPRIIEEINRLGMRRPLFFPRLGRHHLLNRICGFVCSRLRIRGCLHATHRFRVHHR